MGTPFGRLRSVFRRKGPAPSTRTDFHAAQDIAFLAAAAFRVDICPLCGERPEGYLSIYPAPPASRMRSYVVWWCEACGSGFLPDAQALAADYYETRYASEIKQDRAMEPAVYFSPETRKSSAAIDRHLKRVEHQIRTLRRLGGPYETVLDFGSGPGYFLRTLDPPRKYAVEPDRSSQKFLAHIGAESVALDAVAPASLDLIMASHAMEHLLVEKLDATLGIMLSKLRPGGLLYIEVPQAALTALELAYEHEPHTIFFSPRGLDRAVRRAGFEIVERGYRSRGRVTYRDNAIWRPDPSDPFEAGIAGGMTVVARRPAAHSS